MLISFENLNQTGSERYDARADLKIAAPYLSSPQLEHLLPQSETVRREHERIDLDNGLAVFHSQISLSSSNIEESAYRYFSSLFNSLNKLYLYRNWTYMPRINEGGGDRENYRQFCSGRSRAYETHFTQNPENAMAAGTCVGCDGDLMTVITIAGPNCPNHFENPKQVPAYRYPREYGPRSPSFARATAANFDTLRYRFISGTAAVLGHQSVGVGNIEEQLAVTADNLETIAQQTLTAVDTPKSSKSVGKVYLRREEDFPKAKAYFEQRFPEWGANLIYLRSDICRDDLLIEAELTFIDSL